MCGRETELVCVEQEFLRSIGITKSPQTPQRPFFYESSSLSSKLGFGVRNVFFNLEGLLSSNITLTIRSKTSASREKSLRHPHQELGPWSPTTEYVSRFFCIIFFFKRIYCLERALRASCAQVRVRVCVHMYGCLLVYM